MSDKVLLQEILEFTRDGEWGKEEPFENSRHTRVIRGTDFEDIRIGKVNGLPHRHVAERFVEYKELKPFDVLIETAGGSKNTPTGRTLLLKPSLFEKVNVPLVCASFARFLRFDDSKVAPEYLFWHLQFLYRNGVLKQYHVQHTGVARFQFTSFKESEYLELPDRETQQKIASTLSIFDDLIENNSRRIEILEEMARRIYREWFVHFRYPGHEDDELVDSGTELGEIPKGWEVKKLEYFGEIVLGKTPSTKDSANYGDYMPFIKTPDMHDQYFIHETENVLSKKGVETQKKKTLPADSICVSCIGTAGVVAITSVPSQTNQQINSIVPENESYREYLYFVTKDLNPLMEKIGSTGATMTNVSKTKFKGLPALSAPKDVIIDFHEQVGPLFDQMSTLQKQNGRLKETRDLLLPKLISGKIDVKEITIN